MKTTLIVVGSVAVIILLIVRMIYLQVQKQDDVREEFVSKLNYRFSANVDSVMLFTPHAPVGMIYLRPLGYSIINREKRIARGMKRRGLRFLEADSTGILMMFSKDARLYNVGDSVFIDTSSNTMRLFHGRKLVREFVVSEEVRD